MQGTHKDGLPRPYYMKPNTRRGGAYDKQPRQFFMTNSRKLTGYIVLLALFSLCVFLIGQELRPSYPTLFEIVKNEPEKKSTNPGGTQKQGGLSLNNGDVGKLVDSSKGEDKAYEKAQLANNKAENSRGQLGNGVAEAPKGGMVNEGYIVGTDEGLVFDGKTKNGQANSHQGSKLSRGGVQASRGDGKAQQKAPGAAAGDNGGAGDSKQDLLILNEVTNPVPDKDDLVKNPIDVTKKSDGNAAAADSAADILGLTKNQLQNKIQAELAKSLKGKADAETKEQVAKAKPVVNEDFEDSVPGSDNSPNQAADEESRDEPAAEELVPIKGAQKKKEAAANNGKKSEKKDEAEAIAKQVPEIVDENKA